MFAALPDNSTQNPILGFAPHDIVALATRMRPFLGQIGTSPSVTIPDSHNAGDFGAFLIGAPHRYALEAQELQRHKTDGHLDIDANQGITQQYEVMGVPTLILFKGGKPVERLSGYMADGSTAGLPAGKRFHGRTRRRCHRIHQSRRTR